MFLIDALMLTRIFLNCHLMYHLRNFHFEVHVEGRKLLENLDIAEAIGSLLHLSFVFDLKYLKVCQQ